MTTTVTRQELPWIGELRNHIGLRETVGNRHNPTIQQWLREMGGFPSARKSWWADDETPWCGLAVGHALGVSGRYVIPDWYRARSWADDAAMTRLDRPAYGAICIKARKGGGHVFFCVGQDKAGRILALGGNQGNAVSIVPFNAADIDGIYWPSKVASGGAAVKSVPHESRYNLPIGVATGAPGASES